MKGIRKSIENDFRSGSLNVLGQANRKDLKPIPPTKKELEMFEQNISDNIKGVTDEMSKRIRLEIRDSILNNETNLQLSKRLDKIFNGKNPTRFKYEDRLKLIARTERTNVLNASGLKTAKRIGFKYKYLDMVNDERTSEISKAFNKKYGTPEQAIPINEEFKITLNGKTYGGQAPSFHPNDRDILRYLFSKPKK